MILLLNKQKEFLEKISSLSVFKAEYSKVYTNNWAQIHQLTRRYDPLNKVVNLLVHFDLV